MSFVYELSNPATPPKVSSRNNSSRAYAQECKHDRAKRKQDEWTHDAHPPVNSSYFPSLDLVDSSNKKTKTKAVHDNASASQDEVVPCSLDTTLHESPRPQRFSHRLIDRTVKRGREAGSSKDSIQFTLRLLDVNIHENKKRIEECKEQKGELMKKIKELNDLAHHHDVDIRAAERANMQMETQKERLHAHLFAHAYRV